MKKTRKQDSQYYIGVRITPKIKPAKIHQYSLRIINYVL